MKKAKKAFTLIELLVVIAIIAVLLAVLFPALRMAKEHGKRLLCGINLKTIGTALAMYAEQNDDGVPDSWYQFTGTSNNGNRRDGTNSGAAYMLLHIDTTDQPLPPSQRLRNTLEKGDNTTNDSGGPHVCNLAYLMQEDLIDAAPELVYCPSNQRTDFDFEAYGGDEDWPKGLPGPHAPGRIRSSYSYLPQSRTKKHIAGGVMAQFPDQAYKYSKMDPTLSVALDLLMGSRLAHRVGSYTGSNVLFGDGSVEFKRDNENVLNENLIGNADPTLWRIALRVLER